jgi:hypothetical protein
MAGPAVGRLRTGRPGEIKAQARLVDALPGAAADGGSIPPASTPEKPCEAGSWGLAHPAVHECEL